MLDLTFFTKHCKSVLVLDGDISSIKYVNKNIPIIAADGAASKLIEYDITPDVVIGDLDSVDLLKIQSNSASTEIIKISDQNNSDFEKAISYLEKHKLRPPLIIGTNGGYFDHIVNNINICLRIKCVILDYPLIGFTITSQNTIQLPLPINTKISIFGINQCRASTNGLKWELNNALLEYTQNSSSFNRTLTKTITINIHSGKALVLIYLENINDCAIQ